MVAGEVVGSADCEATGVGGDAEGDPASVDGAANVGVAETATDLAPLPLAHAAQMIPTDIPARSLGTFMPYALTAAE